MDEIKKKKIMEVNQSNDNSIFHYIMYYDALLYNLGSQVVVKHDVIQIEIRQRVSFGRSVGLTKVELYLLLYTCV